MLQAKKERDLLHHLFTKFISWPVVSSIIVESAACFGEDHEGRLLDPQSAINFLLSQGAVTGSYKFHDFNMINNKVNSPRKKTWTEFKNPSCIYINTLWVAVVH